MATDDFDDDEDVVVVVVAALNRTMPVKSNPESSNNAKKPRCFDTTIIMLCKL